MHIASKTSCVKRLGDLVKTRRFTFHATHSVVVNAEYNHDKCLDTGALNLTTPLRSSVPLRSNSQIYIPVDPWQHTHTQVI